MADTSPRPIPISHIEGRYLLFDVDAITYLRKHHRICGVFIGTLPQNPSQNVFMGLPMEIMPEEAQVLLDDSVCYLLDDARAHDAALVNTNNVRQKSYVQETETRAAEIANEKAKEKEYEKRRALKKAKAKQETESMRSSTETVIATSEAPQQRPSATDLDDSLFGSNDQQGISHTAPQSTLNITPTSSQTLVPFEPPRKPTRRVPDLNVSSYTLYKHLHSRAYFQTPGLRFGCQFCVYPGDPLRFHSHFLAVGYQWDEELDLMDIIGGGRLGTGVKKGWLIGAKEPDRQGEEGKMRTWSVEWAGM